MMAESYVDFRMQEWRMGEQSQGMQASVRKVLSELEPWALVWLKDPRFEVIVRSGSDYDFSVWAYFPIHCNRSIAKELKPKSETRVLLVFSAAGFKKSMRKLFEDCLRDHIGHVLLYLREPKAQNDLLTP